MGTLAWEICYQPGHARSHKLHSIMHTRQGLLQRAINSGGTAVKLRRSCARW